MTPEQFMANFGAIAEAPDGTKKLRELVLALAVRGQMGTSDEGDPSAAELLEEIAAEKADLVAKKEIKRDKEVAPVDEDAVPFRLPARWSWSRFPGVATIASNLVKPSAYLQHPHVAPDNIEKETGRLLPYRTVEEDKVRSSKHLFFPGALLYSKIRPNLSKAVLVDFEGLCSADMYPLRSHIDRRYLHLFILSKAFLRQVVKSDNRIAMPKVNQQELSNVLVAVPPLAEQKRIVAKVDQLMAMLDDLEQRREKKRTVAIHVSKASLDSLVNAEDPDQLARAWERVSKNFGAIADAPGGVERLRDLVLRLALRGRFSSASTGGDDVLAAAAAERKGAASGRKQKPLKGRTVAHFEIPAGWVWGRIDDIALAVQYGYTAKADHEITATRFLRITDIQNGRVDWSRVPGCEIDTKKKAQLELGDGDLVIARTGGTIGKSFLISGVSVSAVFASYLIRVQPTSAVLPAYLYVFSRSPLYWSQLREGAAGTGQPNVSATTLRGLSLPLPPLAEQKRIVAKVDQLMSMLDHLEGGSRALETAATRLAVAGTAA